MAKRRVQLNLLIDDEANAQGQINAIEARLSTLDVFSIDTPTGKAFGLDNNFENIESDHRFNSTLHAENFRDFVINLWNTPPNPILPLSEIRLHTCPHEEPKENWFSCVVDEVVTK